MAIDDDVLDFNLTSDVFLKSMQEGVEISINATTIGQDNSVVLRIRGVSDRILLVISALRPEKPSVVAWPQEIRWSLGVGSMCVLDRTKYLSGAAPDLMTLTGPTDTRVGVLYQAANMLVGQWALYVALPPGSASRFKAKISFVVDHLGGGAEPAVYKGGLFT